MRTWTNQFGADYAVPDEITKHPLLRDVSWGNDASPSFQVTFAGAGIRLTSDHPEPVNRETKGGRFMVTEWAPDAEDPQCFGDWVADLYEGDDVNQAIRIALDAAARVAMKHPKLAGKVTPEVLQQVPTRKLYRVTTSVQRSEDADAPYSHGMQMVDWYEGVNEEQARADWDEDCHRYGLPMDRVSAVFTECDPATHEPIGGTP